jgi:hypothetical protein
MTWSMIRELRLVVPSVSFGPVYKVTGDWETLVESRQTFEWIKGGCVGALAGLIGAFGVLSSGGSDLVQALKLYFFIVLLQFVTTALDAFWAARHAAHLELVDRGASGLDEWRADRSRQRSWPTVLAGALLFATIGAWLLWAMTQPDSSLNPWFFGAVALLLIGTSIRGVLFKWGKA